MHIYQQREKEESSNITYYFISDKAEATEYYNVEETGSVHTKFPTLRFAIYNSSPGKYPLTRSIPLAPLPLPPFSLYAPLPLLSTFLFELRRLVEGVAEAETGKLLYLKEHDAYPYPY